MKRNKRKVFFMSSILDLYKIMFLNLVKLHKLVFLNLVKLHEIVFLNLVKLHFFEKIRSGLLRFV